MILSPSWPSWLIHLDQTHYANLLCSMVLTMSMSIVHNVHVFVFAFTRWKPMLYLKHWVYFFVFVFVRLESRNLEVMTYKQTYKSLTHRLDPSEWKHDQSDMKQVEDVLVRLSLGIVQKVLYRWTLLVSDAGWFALQVVPDKCFDILQKKVLKLKEEKNPKEFKWKRKKLNILV